MSPVARWQRSSTGRSGSRSDLDMFDTCDTRGAGGTADGSTFVAVDPNMWGR